MSASAVFSTLEGTIGKRGNIMSTFLDVQYLGGYHDACGGIP